MHSRTLHDPAAFALETSRAVLSEHEELLVSEAPAAAARYGQARARFLQFLGGEPPHWLTGNDGEHRVHPFHELDEAALAWSIAAYEAGLAAGAVYEHLRHTLLASGRQCPACDGIGRRPTNPDQPLLGDGPICTECRGRGLIEAE